MKKFLLAFVAIAATSAHAALFNVTLSGSLTETSRPIADPLGLPSLTAWSFEYTVDAPSIPTTVLEAIANTSDGVMGVFTLFEGASVFSTAILTTINTFPTQFTAAIADGPLDDWNWRGDFEGSLLTFEIYDQPVAYRFKGTMNVEASPAAVPDNASTAALASLGLFSLILIRRFRGSR